MKYRVKDNLVISALRITKVNEGTEAPEIELEDGTSEQLNAGHVARYQPVEGDYFVTTEAGYQYLNPKDVFEAKYQPITE